MPVRCFKRGKGSYPGIFPRRQGLVAAIGEAVSVADRVAGGARMGEVLVGRRRSLITS